MSVSVANGVSATTAQFAEYRGTTAPTVGQIGDLWQNTSTSPPTLYQCVSTNPIVYSAVSTGGGGTGTVTSVSGTGTVSGISLSGTVTTAGNITLGGTLAVLPSNFASQVANVILASPNGSSGIPTFRSLVAGDVPVLNQNTTGTAANITATSNTTLTTLSNLSLPGSQVSGNISGNAANVTGTIGVNNGGTGLTTTPTNGQLDIGNGTGFTRTTLTAGTGVSIANSAGGITITNSQPDQTVVLTAGTNVTITGTYPSFTINATGGTSGVTSFNTRTGAVTLTSSDVTTALGFTPGQGTVTSVAALTLGTTGTDVSSTVANSTTTPVITLNIPTASSTNRGALSSTDWTTFNNKGSGTVTSVSGTGTVSGLTLSGTVTTTGSITLGGILSVSGSNFVVQTANTFFAAPSGTTGTPVFRAILPADIPVLNQNTSGTANNVTGVVGVNNGGTGISTNPANGQIDIGNGSGFTRTTLTAGANITITNTAGAITIAASGGGGSSPTKGTATLNFGTYPGSNEASIAVTGQTGILTTSVIQAFLMGDSTSSSYTANDHKYLATLLNLTTNTATAGTGFTIYARSIHKISGTVTVNWTWV